MMSRTPTSLLQDLCNPADEPTNHDAWNRFVDLYAPVLLLWLKRAGLDQESADAVANDVFYQLYFKIRQYDRTKGRFRDWLRTVAINEYHASIRRSPKVGAPLDYDQVADPKALDPAEVFWTKEFHAVFYRRALTIIQRDFSEHSWKAFLLVVVEKKLSAAEAARQVGSTEGAVNSANYRILKRLRDEFGDLWD